MLFRQPQQDPSTAFDPWPYTGWQPPRRSTLDPTSSEDSSAPRRGLAGEATKRLPGGARAQHGCASQRAVARHGGQGGPDAGCAVVHRVRVRVRHPVSSVRCERPVSDGACPGDRRPVRASERPGVQCPASGVCASRCPTGVRLRGVAGGPAAVRLGMAGVGVVARHVHDGASSARGWSLALEAGAGRTGPAEGRLGLGRRGDG